MLDAAQDPLVDVQRLHGRHEVVGDAALLQHLEGLRLVEVVGPRAAAVTTQVLLTDVDPFAALLASGVGVVEAHLRGRGEGVF